MYAGEKADMFQKIDIWFYNNITPDYSKQNINPIILVPIMSTWDTEVEHKA